MEEYNEDNKHNRLKKYASVASVSVAVILAVTKIIASLMSGSLAVLSSMVDSLADIAASSITFISVKYSNKPPSVKYRYGHGKAEALSALSQAAFIGGSGFFVLYDVVDKIINPQPISSAKIGIIVMLFSLVLTLCLVAFQRYVVKITGSRAILADSANYTGDIVTLSSILIALMFVEYLDLHWFDPLAAFLVAVFLIRNACYIGVDAIKVLMDRELAVEVREDISSIVLSNKFVKGLHDLRSRDTGNGEFFEFHLELDGDLTLAKAHDYTEEVEQQIISKYKDAQVVIHQEPAGLDDKRLDAVIKKNSKSKKKPSIFKMKKNDKRS